MRLWILLSLAKTGTRTDDGKKQLTTKDKLCYSSQGYKTMPKTVGAVLPA